MSSAFSLAKILEEVISEVGDLEKIAPYELDSNGKFETESGIKGSVFIQLLDSDDLVSLESVPKVLSDLLEKTTANKLVYNAGFSVNVNGKDTEEKTYDTSLSELLRIYKTLLVRVGSFVKIVRPAAVFIFPTSEGKVEVKSEVYWKILNNYIPFGYKAYSGVKLRPEAGGTKGAMILRNR
jgi:hypothetical protein